MTNVYHYHISGLVEPFTIGCYGPVESIEECKALYAKCDNTLVDVTVRYDDTTIKTLSYDLYCPCWDEDLHSDNAEWVNEKCGTAPTGWIPCEDDATWVSPSSGLNC